ncbi:hypothetical protein Y032_0413g999 [Ancylostoma ceylanicum]|uniref:Uncharacterized protein n=1 Tax=Ancylostoma ceylanicum TaxID=53326 RepID=A0A016X282_9BILA|nr:hypothetical protein Y032_0413g999 [Ancylostoma ceylanicum]
MKEYYLICSFKRYSKSGEKGRSKGDDGRGRDKGLKYSVSFFGITKDEKTILGGEDTDNQVDILPSVFWQSLSGKSHAISTVQSRCHWISYRFILLQ